MWRLGGLAAGSSLAEQQARETEIRTGGQKRESTWRAVLSILKCSIGVRV